MVDVTAMHPARRRPGVATGRRSATAPVRPATLPPLAVSAGAVVVDTLAMAALTVCARALSGDDAGSEVAGVAAGVVASSYLLIGLGRQDYALDRLLLPRGHVARAAGGWCLAFALALALAFLTKSTATYSRGTTLVLFALGLPALPLLRRLAARQVREWATQGRVVARRLMLIGDETAVASFLDRHTPAESGLRLVGCVSLREEPGALSEDLALAVATARLRRPDDVMLLLPWGRDEVLLRALDAFRSVPAAIHLGSPALLERRADLRGDACALPAIRLVGLPMTSVDRCVKRALDVTLAAAALLALTPLLLAIAVAIRLDSPGPVFFRQRRIGFNQQPFRIVKFRSMSVLDDGRHVRQAVLGDSRVTRVGRWLRLSSADELPQLLNVLAGEMSLVGPRPHALAHDQAFAVEHALYARRHTMRPGITGWAQVNGFRGETDTPEKIAGRVRYDLDYIDTWSIWLDLRILLQTVLSPRTFQGAR